MTLPDDDALAAVAPHNPPAFNTLYHRYVERVYRYLRARCTTGEAEDLTQATFLAAWRSLATYQGHGRFAAWLFSIAYRKAMDHARRQRPTWPRDTAVDLTQGATDDAMPLDLAQVRDTLANLPPDLAEAVRLRYFAGLTDSEIGLVLGRSEDAARMLVRRGVQDLTKRLAATSEGT